MGTRRGTIFENVWNTVLSPCERGRWSSKAFRVTEDVAGS